MIKSDIDWGLYLVTDRDLAGEKSIEDVVFAAVRGGVTAVQLREKECTTLEYISLAKRIKRLTLPQIRPRRHRNGRGSGSGNQRRVLVLHRHHRRDAARARELLHETRGRP